MEKINEIKCVVMSLMRFDDYGDFSLTRCAYFENEDGGILAAACSYYGITESYIILISLIVFGLIVGFLIGRKFKK